MSQRALVLDQDTWFQRTVTRLVRGCCPSAEVETRITPDASGDHPLIVVGRVGNSDDKIALVRRLQQSRSDVTVIAFCDDDWELDTLRGSAAAVCGRREAEQWDSALAVIEQSLPVEPLESQSSKTRGFLASVHSIRDLLSEWNSHLEYQEKILETQQAS